MEALWNLVNEPIKKNELTTGLDIFIAATGLNKKKLYNGDFVNDLQQRR